MMSNPAMKTIAHKSGSHTHRDRRLEKEKPGRQKKKKKSRDMICDFDI